MERRARQRERVRGGVARARGDVADRRRAVEQRARRERPECGVAEREPDAAEKRPSEVEVAKPVGDHGGEGEIEAQIEIAAEIAICQIGGARAAAG